MTFNFKLAAAPAFALLIAAAPATGVGSAPITEQDLRQHIEVLASDAFEGRGPGTPAENKTLLYMATRLAQLGFQPAAGAGGWYQPVEILSRKPVSHGAVWTLNGTKVELEPGDLILFGAEPHVSLSNRPVQFVGHGLPEEIRGRDVQGSIVFLLTATPPGEKALSYAERAAILQQAGAAAIIGILDEEVSWPSAVAYYSAGRSELIGRGRPPVSGYVSNAAARRILEAGGSRLAEADSAPTGLRASLDVSTTVTALTTHNLVARLPGRKKSAESVMFLGHWDHLGICRSEGEADRICNGAVDNASGIATLIEVAERLAQGKRPDRDIVILATTAEEMGLLGAEYFAMHPAVPLRSIVAAFNLDTVAIRPRGEAVAILGRGLPALDRIIEETARKLGRRIDTDHEADIMMQRQDGWKLKQAGVPTVMVGGSFSNMERLESFLEGSYHNPDDEIGPNLELGGAAEDADLLVALGRRVADTESYQPPQR